MDTSLKKRRRPLECLRPDVQKRRRSFLKRVRRIPVERLVFLDESGMSKYTECSHGIVVLPGPPSARR
jgi:hypothetical protein